MAKVLENRALGSDFMLMRVDAQNAARMGQFYMLRAWDRYPVLSRPISVFDADGGSVSFLYKVVGKGTALLKALGPGDTIDLDGPHGNGWPDVRGRIALCGGGVGIAPLFLAAKALGALDASSQIDLYLGFSDAALLENEYATVADSLTVDVGGFITDHVPVAEYDHILTCGPEVMMRALYQRCQQAGVQDRLWVSMENRMACGIGACLVCTCKTQSGNRKACADGPVFSAQEVFGL